MIEYRPVLAVTPLLSQQLLLFSGHQSLTAYGPDGKAWETGRLSWEGIKFLEIREDKPDRTWMGPHGRSGISSSKSILRSGEHRRLA